MLKQVDYHAWANIRLFNRLKNYQTMRLFLLNRYRVYFHPLRIRLRIFILRDQVWLHILHGKSMNEAIQDREDLRKQMENKSLHELEKCLKTWQIDIKTF